MKKIFCLAFSVMVSLSLILSIPIASAGEKDTFKGQLVKITGKVVSVNKSAGTLVLRHEREKIVLSTNEETLIIVNSRRRPVAYVPTGIAVFVEYFAGEGGRNLAQSIDDGTGTPAF